MIDQVQKNIVVLNNAIDTFIGRHIGLKLQDYESVNVLIVFAPKKFLEMFSDLDIRLSCKLSDLRVRVVIQFGLVTNHLGPSI